MLTKEKVKKTIDRLPEFYKICFLNNPTPIKCGTVTRRKS